MTIANGAVTFSASRKLGAYAGLAALGLLAALALSERHLGLAPSVREEVERVLAPSPARVDRERAWSALTRDKKSAAGRPRLVLLEAPGRPVLDVELSDDAVRDALDALIAG